MSWEDEGRTSFLKKRSKKLLFPWRALPDESATALQKFFASFFQKRRPSFLREDL
jgi:hypothetical protein